MKRALHVAATLVTLYGVWLLYVDKLEAAELMVGLAAAILASYASEIVRGQEYPRFLPNARMLLPVWRVGPDILRDCFLIASKLIRDALALRGPTGSFLAIRFKAGGDDRGSVARRALAIEFSTMSPNSIIVGIDRRRNVLLFHQLVNDRMPQVAYILGGEAGQ